MSVPRVDKADALAFYLRSLAPALLDGMVREHAFYGPKKRGVRSRGALTLRGLS